MNWIVTRTGNAEVDSASVPLRLTTLPTAQQQYSNAQISSYDPYQRDFQDTPPLRLSLRARASNPADLRGTAGFGFWNHPFAPGERGIRLPQALWFFFSSAHSEMALAQGVAGYGWKAATFNAQRRAFYALLPLAPLAFPLMRLPAFYRRFWRTGQDAIGVREQALPLDLLADWHEYTLLWEPERAQFFVDGKSVLETRHALPRGPLGFIAWIDNQYAIITPQGRFGMGLVALPAEQSLWLDELQIQRG